jgi:hypothetical protein
MLRVRGCDVATVVLRAQFVEVELADTTDRSL